MKISYEEVEKCLDDELIKFYEVIKGEMEARGLLKPEGKELTKALTKQHLKEVKKISRCV